MKVLQIVNAWPVERDPSHGIFIKEQVDSLSREGVENEVYFIDGRRSRLSYVAAIPALRKILRKNSFDLAHAHYGLSGAAALWACARPLVLSLMGSDILGSPGAGGGETLKGKVAKLLSLRAARRADAVIVKSREMAGASGRVDALVIPNGVDIELFRPMDEAECKKTLGLDAAKKYVLFAGGQNAPVKRFGLAREAFSILSRSRGDAELLAISKIPHADMPLYFNACEALLITSLHEGSPNVVKEACACNTKVVSTGVGDVREIFGGVEGFFIAEGNPAAIAAALELAVISARKTAARDAMCSLDLPSVAKEIIKVYEAVLRRKP